MKATTLARLLVPGLLLLGCGGGGGGNNPAAPPASSLVVVDIEDFFFDPKSARINPGDTVRWVRRGADPDHTVTANDGTFDSGFAFRSAGAVFERTFSAAEDGRTFEYLCETHEVTHGMRGSILVGEGAPLPDPDYR